MGWSFVPIKVDTEKEVLTERMRKAVFEVHGHEVFKHLKFESGNLNENSGEDLLNVSWVPFIDTQFWEFRHIPASTIETV